MSKAKEYKLILAVAFDNARDAAAEVLRPYGGKEPVNHMACGFAQAHVVDARCGFVRWCREELQRLGYRYDAAGNLRDSNGDFARNVPDEVHRYGCPGVCGGWDFYNPARFGGQWIEPKITGSRAFAMALNAHGINSRVISRLD